ncbi:chemotaxis protein [Sorangium cellulosum]|uniref:histidine kinase n=1 Tax=Sorangium cellulosum TaxID=56 RepID=A0A4P2Q0R1_SORCE|nr:PAS domain S-box protein [Sorangium cellulosum]AUX22750.1 chemotaxis protein [Sorangium cellulosum]
MRRDSENREAAAGDASRQRARGADGVVVALGASAGGLEALRSFLSAMPPDSGLAFVLAHHDPQHASAMPELLAPHTAMRVQEAVNGLPIEPNHVYVFPSNAAPTIQDGVFRPGRLGEPRGHRAAIDAPVDTPIDVLFRALAEDRKQRAVAVVLSGSGHEGVTGLRAVREHGGLAIAQHPATAHPPEMPRHAIAAGLVHYVLALRDIPAALLEHARRVALDGDRARLAEEEIAARLPEICGLLLERTARDFREYKRTTLLRRVQQRAQVLRATSIADYVALLRRDADEPAQLVRDLLIGVTEFFRDADTFEALRQEVVPALFTDRGADGQVRIWVPGCATGEEVYTIAMLLQEHVELLPGAPRVQLFGTDVDDRAIEVARQGRYPRDATQHIAPHRFARFFVAEEGGTCSVAKAIRDLCIFSRHDLITDPPFSRLDLISCRNVLIYLEGELQKRLLELFHYALVEGGYLLLGPSESVSQRSELFRAIDAKRRIFQKKRAVGHAPPRLLLGEGTRAERRAGEPLRRGAWSPEQSIERTIERRLLERYGPPCVVVNEQGDIVYLSGATGKYLAPSTGALDVNVSNMVLRALRPEVRSAVHRAVRMREQVVHENIAVETIAGTQRLNLVVRPLGDLEDDLGLFVVLFDELQPPARGEAPPPGPKRESASLVDQLEHELQATRENLQTTIEELETSNEELKSSNEELLSMNEELQSLNQEFEALNGELQAKLHELDAANSDLQNLLLSTQIPTVFLDEELRIRRFTPAAAEVFRLIDSDVGRPITDIAARFDASSLAPDARGVLRTLAPRQRDVILEDGRSYMMRILPYRTLTNVISGVVVTLVNVTSVKDAEVQRGRLAAIVESAEQAIIGATTDGAITSWNAAAERMFGYSEAEVVGRSIHLIVPPERAGEVRAVLDRVIGGERLDALETLGLSRDGRRVDVSINVAPIRDAGGQIIGASTIVDDITRRKRAEEALRASEEDFRSLFESAVVGKMQCEPASGRFVRVNRRFARMLGYEPSELLGKTFLEVVAPEDASTIAGLYAKLLRGEVSDFAQENRYLMKDGRRLWASTTVTAMRDGAGRAVRTMAVVQDITQRKEVEADLIKAREAAEHASRTKDHFLAVLSHELRTPLTPVVTAAARLLRRDDLVDDVRRSVAMIQRNAELEARLIDDLLDLTRVVRGKLELFTQTVRARAVLEHALEICADEIDAKSIRLTLDVAPGEHWIAVDVARLEQVVWNLLKNAVKFSHPGSRIGLACRDEGGQVVIEVRDEGVGIEPEILPRIFDAFEQGNAATTRNFGGLGLGLAISRAIVQLHGGTITAASPGRGAGATFRVALPAAEGPAATAPAQASAAGVAAPRRALRIALVEDHEDTAEMMSELLTLNGHTVRIARSVRAALDLVGAEPFDLLVSDLGLPDGSGTDLLASLRSAGHEIKAIALSGYGMEEDHRKTADAGFLEHLVKPVSFRDLEAAIQRVMGPR